MRRETFSSGSLERALSKYLLPRLIYSGRVRPPDWTPVKARDPVRKYITSPGNVISVTGATQESLRPKGSEVFSFYTPFESKPLEVV